MIKQQKRKGYTLSEVIITLIILSTLGVIIAVIFNATFAGRDLIDKEASIQAEMRIAMQNVNNSVEKATAIFVLDDTKYNPSDPNFKMTEKWSYIGLSADGKKIVNHIWNEENKTWDVKELGSESLYGLKLALNFETDTDYQDNRIIKYDVTGQYPDSDNVLKLDTAVMALKSKQVFSKVSKGKSGIAIAYRTEDIQGQSIPTVAVSIVFDVSESMAQDIDAKEITNKSKKAGIKSRMENLKEKANILIDDLSNVGRVKVNLVEFGWGGEYVMEKFEDLGTSSAKVKNAIKKFEPKGATNPGAGLRYGLVSLAKETADIKYVIILTDGGPNVYTRYRKSTKTKWSERVKDYDLTDNVKPNDLSQDIWADNVRPKDSYSYYYPGKVAEKFKNGINHVHFIAYSGVDSERSAADYMTADINKYIPATKHDATTNEGLKNVFSTITNEIAKDLWFVAGP